MEVRGLNSGPSSVTVRALARLGKLLAVSRPHFPIFKMFSWALPVVGTAV